MQDWENDTRHINPKTPAPQEKKEKKKMLLKLKTFDITMST